MMVDIAKMFRSVKNTIGTVKDSIEEEVNMTDIKKEALAYKEQLLDATEDIGKIAEIPKDISTGLSGLNADMLDMNDTPKAPKAKKESENVTFAKKAKKTKKQKEEKKDEVDV
jgi:sec-independent protein translocase protein TatB